MNAAEMSIHVYRIEHESEYRERWFSTLARTVAVDFDGVIHPYTNGWVTFEPEDEPPMAGIDEFFVELREKGFRIVVFSTRCESERGLSGTKAWLEKYGLMQYIDDVTCQKPAAIAYVDDRAVPYHGDFGDCLVDIYRLADGRPSAAAKRAR